MSVFVLPKLIVIVMMCCSAPVTSGNQRTDSLSTHSIPQESRKKQDVLSSIIPMLAMPFITQTILLPVILFFMKLTLVKSIFLGKLGVILWVVNIIRNRLKDGEGGFYSHNVNLDYNDHQGHMGHSNMVYHRDSNRNNYYGYDSRRKKRRVE